MEYNIKSAVIKQAIMVMITDPDVDNSIYKNSDTDKLVVIDYALHFSEMFYKNEVANMVDFFDKMYHKKIFRKNYFLTSDEKKDFFTFIDNFIDTYNKKETSDGFSFEEKKIILCNTINELKRHFEILGDFRVEKLNYNKKNTDKLHNKYLKIIENIETRMYKHKAQSITTLLSYIKKAKMDYILRLDEKTVIYPILYDLLLISFEIEARLEEKSYVDGQSIFDTFHRVRNNIYNLPEDKRYADIEYLKISELLTQIEAKELQQFLIYHYSKILNSRYNDVLSVFKQLRHAVTDHNKHEYKYKDFSYVTKIAAQDLRLKSLYVV